MNVKNGFDRDWTKTKGASMRVRKKERVQRTFKEENTFFNIKCLMRDQMKDER